MISTETTTNPYIDPVDDIPPNFVTFPVCLYQHKTKKISKLIAPNVKNNKYICQFDNDDWEYSITFYTLSYKLLPPTPGGTVLYKITNNSYQTTKLKIIRNLYTETEPLQTSSTFTILGYTYSIPPLIPLFIYKVGEDELYISLTKQSDLIPHNLSPIYVMDKEYTTWKCVDGIQIPIEIGGNDWNNACNPQQIEIVEEYEDQLEYEEKNTSLWVIVIIIIIIIILLLYLILIKMN